MKDFLVRLLALGLCALFPFFLYILWLEGINDDPEFWHKFLVIPGIFFTLIYIIYVCAILYAGFVKGFKD